jgi:protein-S-isoprenylcysteine O-methyltransferase Ste14
MSATSRGAGTAKTPIQIATLAVGAVFLLVGVLGFVPGVTTHYDSMTAAGHHSNAMLLGLFNVSVLHNVVHLLFGAAGILMARSASLARTYLIGGGAIYLVLFVYGLVIDHDSAANFVPLNTADNWLHLVLGVGMIGLGVLLGSRASRTSGTASRASAEQEGRVQ